MVRIWAAVVALLLAGAALWLYRELRASRRYLAGVILEQARAAQREARWEQAARLYAESDAQSASDAARWGFALARERVPKLAMSADERSEERRVGKECATLCR